MRFNSIRIYSLIKLVFEELGLIEIYFWLKPKVSKTLNKEKAYVK